MGALAVGFINAGDVSGGPFTRFGWGQMVVSVVVFAAAWGLVGVRSRRLGLGAGRDGYGLLLGGLAVAVLVLPFIAILVGPLGVVGPVWCSSGCDRAIGGFEASASPFSCWALRRSCTW